MSYSAQEVIRAMSVETLELEIILASRSRFDGELESAWFGLLSNEWDRRHTP